MKRTKEKGAKPAPAAPSFRADGTQRLPKGVRTHSMAIRQYCADLKSGKRKLDVEGIEKRHEALRKIREQNPAFNKLFEMPERKRVELYKLLRESPPHDLVIEWLAEQGINYITPEHIEEFYQEELNEYWRLRTQRAADEADAVIRIAEENVPKFSSGMLAALGQIAFRAVSNDQIDPEVMKRLAKLFMEVRSSSRTDQMAELKQRKLHNDIEGQIELALEKLALEVEQHPAAREAFEALKRELSATKEENA